MLTPDTKLGQYRIIMRLRGGGSGEAYRALDTRMQRTVMIVILPEYLAETPEARERFEREARAVSELNHPHICALYDICHEQEMDFLVMEYLEGETLKQRLERGPIPVPEALQHRHLQWPMRWPGRIRWESPTAI